MSGIPLVYDLYRIQVQFRQSTDPRPGLIVRIRAGAPNPTYGCALISGQFDLFDERTDFAIEEGHVNFSATGLRKKSYVTSKFVFDLGPNRLLKRLGTLSGDLLVEFEAWWRDIA